MKNLLVLLCVISTFASLQAKVTLAPLIGEAMVLQRNSEANLWGWSEPNREVRVSVSWSEESFATTANGEGEWLVRVPTGEAMWGQSVTIDDGDKVTLNNVMLGDVWICSGQSNMAMSLMGLNNQYVEGAMQTLATARNYPNIHIFTVGRNDADHPIESFSSDGWMGATSENVAFFSAVAYYFARTITDFVGSDIPIGLVQDTWVGTRIEAWMSKESIDNTEGIDQEYTYNIGRTRRHRSRLYNAMIYPIRHYTAKGFLWYQGESNWDKWEDYHLLMASMVEQWRKDWGDETMPFYYVQLAPFVLKGAGDINIPLTVEAQVKALDLIPHSAMVGTTDLGHSTGIHPPRKEEVGRRLAYIALRRDYALERIPEDAPRFREMTIKGDTAHLSFYNTTREGSNNSWRKYDHYAPFEIKGFEMAGEDRVFHPATAQADGGAMVVTCPAVSEPVAVRYGFYNLTDANAMTVLGQPLIPFRTDRWYKW